MSKFTNVHDLLISYQNQHRKIPAKGVYASRERREELQASHIRKLRRKRKRSVGKSNKLGFRLSAEIRAAMICEANFLAMVFRESRNNFRGK